MWSSCLQKEGRGVGVGEGEGEGLHNEAPEAMVWPYYSFVQAKVSEVFILINTDIFFYFYI